MRHFTQEPLNSCTTGYQTPLAVALKTLSINLRRVGINADRIARGFKPIHWGGPYAATMGCVPITTWNPLWFCTFVRNLKIAALMTRCNVRTWADDETRGAA